MKKILCLMLAVSLASPVLAVSKAERARAVKRGYVCVAMSVLGAVTGGLYPSVCAVLFADEAIKSIREASRD